MVNFQEPVFESVTHLYTSVLIGHRDTWVGNLPHLTHLAVHTRVSLPGEIAILVVEQIARILEAMPQLEHFALVLGSADIYDLNLEQWKTLLEPCFKDKRFNVLPYFRDPRMEWLDMLEGRPNIWERTHHWCSVDHASDHVKIQHRSRIWQDILSEQCLLPKVHVEAEWEIDLVQRDTYSPYEGDPTERREANLSGFH